MNPANYDIKTLIVSQGIVGVIDLPCCKRCGSLVGDMDAHDEDHKNKDTAASAAYRADALTARIG